MLPAQTTYTDMATRDQKLGMVPRRGRSHCVAVASLLKPALSLFKQDDGPIPVHGSKFCVGRVVRFISVPCMGFRKPDDEDDEDNSDHHRVDASSRGKKLTTGINFGLFPMR